MGDGEHTAGLLPGREGSVDAILRAIRDEFAVAMGSRERVAASLCRLDPFLRQDPEAAIPLLDLLDKRNASLVPPVFNAIEDCAARAKDPWVFLPAMLSAQDAALAERAVALFCRIAAEEPSRMRIDAPSGDRGLTRVALAALAPGAHLSRPDVLAPLARGLRGGLAAVDGEDPLLRIYLDGPSAPPRLLAALILDGEGAPSAAVRARILDPETEEALAPYFEYTRISHREILALPGSSDARAALRGAVRHAESVCGERLARALIAEIGWERLRDGFAVVERVGIAIDACPRLIVSPAEAALFDAVPGAARTGRWFFVRARGRGVSASPNVAEAAERAAHRPGRMDVFRGLTLLHAEVLRDFLDLSPLTARRVRSILGTMGEIVDLHRRLFLDVDEECRGLDTFFAGLRERILGELPEHEREETEGAGESLLPPEPTRLVQMFEDPRTLADTTTLHGLKRYLHQRGLRLAFRLVDGTGGAESTCDLAVATPDRVLRTYRGLSYVDFDAAEPFGGDASRPDALPPLPACVRIAAEGIERHLLDATPLPDVKLFCFGNEIHGYIHYGSHPAFVRIDLSPPASGGMLDLEYYGVSKVHGDQHPAPDLPAVQRFFRRMDCDVKVERTRIRARYDKEHGIDLDDLLARVAAFFRLVPYLMDLDWTIGSLRLSESARERVADAWSEHFHAWGTLPLERILTEDRLGIIASVATVGAGQRRAICWDGEGPYRDRLDHRLPPDLPERIETALAESGLAAVVSAVRAPTAVTGQLALERIVLAVLRAAVVRGEIVERNARLHPAPAYRFARTHEAIAFADLLDGGEARLARAARMAAILAAVERSIRFETTATLNGHPVQAGCIALPDETLGVFVLRDVSGVPGLGIAARGAVLHRSRQPGEAEWTDNVIEDPDRVLAELRRHRFLTSGPAETAALLESAEPRGDLPARFRRRVQGSEATIPRVARRRERAAGAAGPAVIRGRTVAPGHTRGFVLFGTRGRAPADLRGAVLAAPSLRPEEGSHLREAAGLLTTGGGILSHAGLLAVQYAKPSLIVGGTWIKNGGAAGLALDLPYEDYEEERHEHGPWTIVLRCRRQRRSVRLRERDLVILDATDGVVRVLGRDPDAVTLHQELRLLDAAGAALARCDGERDVLDLRGRRLRAIHQLEKLLGRIADPDFALMAVREILRIPAVGAAGRGDASRVLRALLRNASVGPQARAEIRGVGDRGARALLDLGEDFLRASDEVRTPFAILSAWVDLAGRRARLASLARLLRDSGEPASPGWEVDMDAIREHTVRQLAAQCGALERELAPLRARGLGDDGPPHPLLRHRLRQIGRIREVLDGAASSCVPARSTEAIRAEIVAADRAAVARAHARYIIWPGDGGLELAPIVGGKGAYLGEIVRHAGDATVPAWFVVGDAALRRVLEQPAPGLAGSLGETIAQILSKTDGIDEQIAFVIRKLWEAAAIPGDVRAEIETAYGALRVAEDEAPPWVAIRSSGVDEDAEDAFRAGEFDSFLFVRDLDSVMHHVRLVWAGLWTARAIARRRAQGSRPMDVGGGVIVQRIVRARASGVLQTINVAEGRAAEMVVSAGLGLGEGIVAGTVGADHFVIDKTSVAAGRLRMRVTICEKAEKVVFDERRGSGTTRVPALYHERQRACLEYVEILELARAAALLEDAYGAPLDIEFAFEGARLRILQVRPVVTYAAVLRAVRDHHPLCAPRAPRAEDGEPAGRNGKE